MKEDKPGKRGIIERIKEWDRPSDATKAEQEERAIRMLQEQREARQKQREEKARQREYASRTTFTVWDYVLLESVRRKDPRIRIRIGTMKVLTSLERLALAGWIEKPANKMPFDDTERLEAFRDSNEYKLYQNRLDRIMSGEDYDKMDRILDMLKIKKIDDWLVLTDEGKPVAEEHRSKIRLKWDKLRRLYLDKSAKFQQAAEDSMEYLPLFLTMGLVNGAMMAQMMSDAHVDYPYWYGDLYVGGSFNTWADDFDGDGGDFDDGPDFGGF